MTLTLIVIIGERQLSFKNELYVYTRNFNGQRPAIDANDAVMLLIDHQSGPVSDPSATCRAGNYARAAAG